MAESKKLNVYEAVTDRLIAQLDQGIIPWSKPWTGRADGAISGTTGKAYSLLNQFLLSKPGKYYTFRQRPSSSRSGRPTPSPVRTMRVRK
jgi:antirestriction protein ArdC